MKWQLNISSLPTNGVNTKNAINKKCKILTTFTANDKDVDESPVDESPVDNSSTI